MNRKHIMYLLLFLPFLWALTSHAQVTANFTASKTSGCSPLLVNFTSTSTGSPTTYFWSFGNGNTSTLQNPSASFVSPGTYTVSLTVSNGTVSNTVIKTAYITVFANP